MKNDTKLGGATLAHAQPTPGQSNGATRRQSLSVDGYVAAARSAATQRGYAADVRHFQSKGGRIPAAPQQLAAYIAELAATLAVATIERRLIAIHRAHVDKGLDSPARDALVKQTMAGVRRTLGTRQRQAKALVKDDLLEMLVMVDKRKPMQAARDRALLLVGFAGAFRRSELVAIRCEDITEHANGLEVLIRRSKTDQAGAGRTVFIPHARGTRCPVKALWQWLELAEITSGWVFRAVSRHDKVGCTALSAQSVALIVKVAAKRAGGDPTVVSGHSLRAGYVTTAAEAGLQPHQIKEQTGHRSDAMLARYIRPVANRKTPSLL
ncbi:site-specific integrase [Cupriavidus basilensis]|uniref:Site-specific integrase n=1 Tax=Cupriavidus basilensis TaxID=68895 RepID=A0ABT6ATF2_9BURK|nr:site-specific integrase [Cupriavidus basilensis]MDF3835904.1 site-specific integrase [Cupriavidus basilensis]